MAEGFEGLEVWQSAHKLRILTHKKIVPRLPREEKFDLAFQIRKSSKSIGANIAEGYGRFYYQDNVRFCYMARGSLDETIDHLIDARDLDYLDQGLYSEARSLADQTRRLLNGYIAFLRKRKVGANEPGADRYIREIRAEYGDLPADDLIEQLDPYKEDEEPSELPIDPLTR